MKYQDEEMNKRYLRAKKKTESIRKFYTHLIVYILANIAISTIKVREYMQDGDTFEEAFFQFDTFAVWMIWGVFVVLQAIKTFKTDAILGADWEERKIKELMNEGNHGNR